jgi:hypothetical protein
MKPSFVKRIAIRTLGNLESFIMDSRLMGEPKRAASTKDGDTVGIYVNSPNSFLIVSELGVRVFHSGGDDYCGYEQITVITKPESVDRDLDLMLASNSAEDVRCLSFPVLGETERLPDIGVFYKFLRVVIDELQISSIRLRRVRTIDDFIDYVRTECERDEHMDALADYLEKDFDADSFDRFKIDKAILDIPDFWRAVVVILNLPITLWRDPEELATWRNLSSDEQSNQ